MTKQNKLILIGGALLIAAAFHKWRERPVQVKVITGVTGKTGNPSDEFASKTPVPTTAILTVPASQVEQVMQASLDLADALAGNVQPQTMPGTTNLTGISSSFMTN